MVFCWGSNNYTKIYAPIDGIIGIKKFDIGNLVGSNDENSSLITITNTNPVYAEFALTKDDASRYISQIKNKNAKINLITSTKTYENGNVDFISPKIDSNTDTLLVVGSCYSLPVSGFDCVNIFRGVN